MESHLRFAPGAIGAAKYGEINSGAAARQTSGARGPEMVFAARETNYGRLSFDKRTATMIDEWSSPSERAAFLASSFGRQPYAQPGAARASIPLLRWTTLDRVLRSPLACDAITVAAGHLVDVPAPRSSADVRALMARGISTVVRTSERHDDGFRRLAAAFDAVLPGAVHVQVYATPTGTYSYGWHYDFEDVFIVQTLGIKDYYMRANTTAVHTRFGEALDFRLVREEKSALMKARLIAGDWLYIPRRWWHFVQCAEESLSISVGVMPSGETSRTLRAVEENF
jgi:50S ribosomal protein L16 3-hydroxylase